MRVAISAIFRGGPSLYALLLFFCCFLSLFPPHVSL